MTVKFETGRRYWSDDRYEMYVVDRFDRTGLIRVEVGFAMPANYKIRKDYYGCEYIIAKGREFRAASYAEAISIYRKLKMKETENEKKEKQEKQP